MFYLCRVLRGRGGNCLVLFVRRQAVQDREIDIHFLRGRRMSYLRGLVQALDVTPEAPNSSAVHLDNVIMTVL